MEITNPHDKFFKETFSKRKNVIDFIKGTFPKELTNRLNLSSLKLDHNSYVDEELKENFSDTVYNCEYKTKFMIKIALLFEHKSKKPRYPHLQLLQYMLNSWRVNIKQGLDIIPIIPIVVYHGKVKWKFKKLAEYFKDFDNVLEKFIPDFDYLLIDLSRYSDEEIKGKIFLSDSLSITLLLMKHIFYEEELRSKLYEFIKGGKKYFEGEEGLNFIVAMTIYLFSATGINKEEIIKTINKVSKEGGRTAMTTAEKLRQEGRQEGLQRGILGLHSKGVSVEEISKLLIVDREFIKKTIKSISFRKTGTKGQKSRV